MVVVYGEPWLQHQGVFLCHSELLNIVGRVKQGNGYEETKYKSLYFDVRKKSILKQIEQTGHLGLFVLCKAN